MEKLKEEKMCPDVQFCGKTNNDCFAKKSICCVPAYLGRNHSRLLYIYLFNKILQKGSYDYGDPDIKAAFKEFYISGGDEKEREAIENRVTESISARKKIKEESNEFSNSSEGGRVLQLTTA